MFVRLLWLMSSDYFLLDQALGRQLGGCLMLIVLREIILLLALFLSNGVTQNPHEHVAVQTYESLRMSASMSDDVSE